MTHLIASILLLLPSLAVAADWPNEPAGATVLQDMPHDGLTSNGWYDIYGGYQTKIIQDPTAPVSPPNVLQQKFLPGKVGGNTGGGGNLYMFPTPLKGGAFYWANWMKVDPRFENHPVGTKIDWIHTGVGKGGQENQLFLLLTGGGPFQINANYQNATVDNTALGGDRPKGTLRIDPSGYTFKGGEWVLIERLFQPASCPTCRNGIWKVWLNKNPVINVTTLNTENLWITGVSHITVWGGTGSTSTRDSYIWWDHEHLSTTAAGVVAPPVVPITPGTILNLDVKVTE